MTGNQKKALLALGTLLIVFILAWLLWPGEKFNPWAPTTVPYSTDCPPEDCVTAEPSKNDDGHTHGSSLPLVYNPKVDDAVAQWGDCIDEVLRCIDSADNNKSVPACVSASACPAACIERFQHKLGKAGEAGIESTENAALDAFEAVFIVDEADCRPERSQ